MNLKLIEEQMPYSEFLRVNDNNFEEVKASLSNIWEILASNYLVNPDSLPVVNFKKLFSVKDDSNIYNNWIYNFDELENMINSLIKYGFNQNSIISTSFHDFVAIELDVPETICFTKKYINQVNKDWTKVDSIINNLNESLIFYGFRKG